MKRILIGIGGLLAFLVVGALVAPSFIDWNQYRAKIAARASAALGRAVEIRGDVRLSLLPSPVLAVRDAHLANVEGASEDDAVSLEQLEVHFAVLPLLAGDLRIQSVKLAHPVVDLEVMEAGRTNLTFEPAAAPAGAGVVKPPPGSAKAARGGDDSGGLDVRVDSFVVEKGTLTFRNAAKGIVERIDNINGRFSLASLKGPVEAIGSAVVRGVPLSFEAATGAVIQGRTVPINLDLAVIPGNVRLQFSGFVNGLNDVLKLTGKVAVDGKNLRDFGTALGASLPEELARPFGLEASVTASSLALELANLVVKLDNQQLTGKLNAAFGKGGTIDASLSAPRLDIDTLLAAAVPASTKPVPTPIGPVTGEGGALSLPEPQMRPAANAVKLSLAAVPPDLTVNVNLAVDALSVKAALLQQAKVSLALENREITVNQISAQLPGAADAALFGFVAEKDGQPQFDGTLDVSSGDLRGTLAWLGLTPSGVSPERLRRLTLNARVSARPDQIGVPELHAKLDGSDVEGALTIALRDRPSFGANLVIDRLNLDGYLGGSSAAAPAPAGAAEPSPAPSAPKPSASAPQPPRGPLGVLGAVDANVRAKVGALTYANLPFNDVRLEAGLIDGVADIKSLSVGDLAGVSGGLSGGVSGLKTGQEPTFHDLVLQAKGKSLVPLLRLSGVNLGPAANEIGAAQMSARLNGALQALEMAGEVDGAGGRASFEGKLQTTELLPRIAGSFSLSHPDLVKLARMFAPDYRPARAKGAIDLSGRINASPLDLAFTDLVGTVGDTTVQGGAAVNLLAGRPKIAAQLVTGDLDIDAFLPAKRTAEIESPIRPASFIVPEGESPASLLLRVATAPVGHWSSEPFNLAPLRALDGALTVKSDSLKYGGLTLANTDLDVELAGGTLNLRKLAGKTMGGTLTADGMLAADAAGTAKFESRYALQGADVGAAERAFGGRGAAKGSMALDGNLSGAGRSMADLVASLAGEGNVALKGVDVGDGASGGLAAVGALVQSLDRVAAAGGSGKGGLVDISGPYKVSSGIVTFDNLAFASSIGDGTVHGTADLPKWRLDAKGEIKPSKGLLAAIAKDGGEAKPLPFELNGPLDAPRVKIDIAKLPGGGLRIPNPKELLKKIAPKEQPSASTAPADGAAQPAPAPADQPASTKSKVDDVIKNIVKGFRR